MSQQDSSQGSALTVRLAHAPGGLARQFRVQVLEQDSRGWHQYAAFRRRDLAEACAGRLLRRGFNARVVDVDRCPTAA